MSGGSSKEVLGTASKQSLRGLLDAFKAKRSKGQVSGGRNEDLIQIAQKRRSDTIKFTQHMLKTRLVQDLDETMDAHLREFPEMRDQFFVGILTDQAFRAEVVPMETAIASVEDATAEDAEAVLRSNPVGYFKSEDFTLKTPSDEGYQKFKERLDSYFKRNADVIDYLRKNPQADTQFEDFYKTPPGS